MLKGYVSCRRNNGGVKLGCAVCLLALAIFFGAAPAARAAKAENPLKQPEAYLIKLHKDPSGGKTAFLKGIATPEGAILKLKNLWITQDVFIMVIPGRKGGDIKAELRKYHWQKPDRKGSTRPNGQAEFIFRTQGDVYLKLISPSGPAQVYVAVRVGDKKMPSQKPVIIPKGAKK